MRTLIDRGANVNGECDNRDETGVSQTWTPLHVASSQGRLEVARLLLEHGANVNHPDEYGRTLLFTASRYSYEDLARLLLDYGANPYALAVGNQTALHEASFRVAPGVVRLLLDHGLDVNARSTLGLNPLHLIWEYSYSEGWTPLHYAAQRGCVEVAQVLLDYGADVNMPDQSHWTALHLSAFYEHLQVVDILLRRGANPHARTIEGHTPFEVTKERHRGQPLPDHQQIMGLLSEHVNESEHCPQSWT